MQVSKTKLAAALVATLGLAAHAPAFSSPTSGTNMGANEQQAPSIISQAAADDKGKDSSCKGKKSSCKAKAAKGKKSSCKAKEGAKKTETKTETKTEETKTTK